MTLEEFKQSCIDETENKLKILAAYQNGNHYECIFEDGTKIKDTINPDDDHFTYSFPTNFDFKINNRCDGGCIYCHENSTVNGAVPSLKNLIGSNFINSLHAGTEMAIGGGNIFESPDLVEFLSELKQKNIVTNVTVNQKHIKKNFDTLKMLVDKEYVHGIGISFTSRNKEDFKLISKLGNNVVIHIINGIFTPEDLPFIIGRKILILGYKDLRRGHTLLQTNKEEIEKNQKWLKENLARLSKLTRVMSFDCLGIEQLNPKETLNISDEQYDYIFQGEDTDVLDNDGNITCATMYIDLPNMQVGRHSCQPIDQRKSFTIDEPIEVLFKRSVDCWVEFNGEK